MLYKRSRFPNSHHWRYELGDQRGHKQLQEGDQVIGVFLQRGLPVSLRTLLSTRQHQAG